MGHATVVVQTNDTYRRRSIAADEAETVAALGEFGLIAALSGWLRGISPADPRTLVGIGDDAAVLAAPDGRVVASTDFLLEGRHFRRDGGGNRRRSQGRGPEPDRRRGHGRGAGTGLLVALAAPPQPAGHLGPRTDRGSRGRVRPGRRNRDRRGHRQRRVHPARHHRPGQPGRPGPGPALRRRPRQPGRRDGPARPRHRQAWPCWKPSTRYPCQPCRLRRRAQTPPPGRVPSSPPSAGRNRPTTRVRRRPTWAPRP